MKSLDLKIRYGITIVTLLLFLLAVKSSFGQKAENTNVIPNNTIAPQQKQNDQLVDPLSPAVLNTVKVTPTGKTENVTLSNGRVVNVDVEGVQSLSIPRSSETAPVNSKTELNRKEN